MKICNFSEEILLAARNAPTEMLIAFTEEFQELLREVRDEIKRRNNIEE